MAEKIMELPVAIGVYSTKEGGIYHVRQAGYQQPTLLFDPFYVRAVRELQELNANKINSRLTKAADVRQLLDIAGTFDEQQQLFSVIVSRFAEFNNEKNLPPEIVKRFFRSVAASYSKLAFAEQTQRLQELKEASGFQIDLLSVLKTPVDTPIYGGYERIYRATKAFFDRVSEASELFDRTAEKLYANRPSDLVKFGGEPEVFPSERTGNIIVGLEATLHKIATDKFFAAEVSRRRREALEDVHTIADRLKTAVATQSTS